ncbi:OmpA family protein [Ekhidna sp.]|uniref:OmpA family protein n=1 Tax=Ekhidna sp. TaxID=2608089 RepID=UPI003BAC488E
MALAVSFMVLAYVSKGQDGLPENPEPGKCYAKCVAPDEYKEETERVMLKPAYTTLEVIPAEYKEVTETVVIKPETKKYILEPAEYKTVYDTIWIKDPYNKLSVVPEEFSNDVQTVEIKSKTGRWVAGEKDPDCPSIDPDDCRVLHFVEIPAVTRDVSIKKKVKDQTTSSKKVEGKYQVVAREEIVKEPTYRTEVIPAETKEIVKTVLVKDETTREVTVDAIYTDVTKRVLVKQGGLTVWREVPCTIPSNGTVLPINYEVGSAELTRSSLRIIDTKLLTRMQEEPNSIVEIGSHTDARGSAEANQSLSERRAKSVVEYLISKGIDKERLLAVGYGETKPLNECVDGVQCSDSKHAANRRTEFKVF